jgi:hypothetical protein
MRFLIGSALVLISLTFAGIGHTDRFGNEDRPMGAHRDNLWRHRIPANGILPPGTRLHAGESVSAPNREFQLACQRDGNLVLYRQGRPLWSSGTAGRGVRECVMQTDGNLVLYGHSRDGGVVWMSNTAGNPGAFLAVQDDGNVVIYRPAVPIWATDTYR